MTPHTSPLRALSAPFFAAALLIFGLLLFVEEIRLYRDLEMDGPLALACWGLAILISGYAIWKKIGSRALNIILLVLNLLVLGLVLLLLALLSGPMRLF
ncbi:MAG: hypothetical protein M5R41_01350 [Bacteroidia bacterium]|nr:hypothetical protein [Bacteroidia bacterium]